MKTRVFSNPLAPNPAWREIYARVPDESDVLNLQVGDMAPDCFGWMAHVTAIYARSRDRWGRAFVCYYAAMSDRDTAENGCGCSNTMKDGELLRTVALTSIKTSAECDVIENDMQTHMLAMG